jgi:MoaA/NifB/PqqE/SkfB family radical SAM enzyme
MHDWHTGVAGSFAQTVQGLYNARAERIPAGVTVVVTRSNYRHLTEIGRVAHAAGADAIHFATVAIAGRAARARASLSPAPAMVAPHLQRAWADAARLGLLVQVGDGTTRELAASGSPAQLFAGLGEVEPPTPGCVQVEVHP